MHSRLFFFKRNTVNKASVIMPDYLKATYRTNPGSEPNMERNKTYNDQKLCTSFQYCQYIT